MSGPPYPRYAPGASPGGNALARPPVGSSGSSFIIGSSPIGDITVFDVWTTVISQYANSPILTGIITAFAAAMDATEDLDNFFDLVMNVYTAQGYGLDVWGRIVGAPRTIPVAVIGIGPTFGFQESGGDWQPFGQGTFSSGGGTVTTNATLTDAQYLPLVLAKARTNIWDGSIPGFNEILLQLFSGRGTPYVQDNGNMSITIHMPFTPTALDLAVINSGVLPQPAGVVINVVSP